MAEAGDREQFGYTLDQADDRGLQEGQMCHARPFAVSWAAGATPDALRPAGRGGILGLAGVLQEL